MNSFIRSPQSNVVLAKVIFFALVIATSEFVRADDPKPEEKKKWESVASAGITLTRGNSRNFLGTASILSTRKWTQDELLLGASGGYGETTARSSGGAETTSKTDDYLKGFAQWNHLINERLYAGIRLNAEHDDIADLDYRFTLSPLVGYYFIKQTNVFLSGEIGPSFVEEKKGGKEKSYIAARVGQRFEYKFKSGARIWEMFEWMPQVDKFENWILNAEAGISAPITKSLDVRLVAQDTYNNQPASGRLKNDFKLIGGIGYRF